MFLSLTEFRMPKLLTVLILNFFHFAFAFDCDTPKTEWTCQDYEAFFLQLENNASDTLNCINYNSWESPQKVLGESDSQDIDVQIEITRIKELDPRLMEMTAEKLTITSWIDERLAWPEACRTKKYETEVDMDHVWTPHLKFFDVITSKELYKGLDNTIELFTVSNQLWKL